MADIYDWSTTAADNDDADSTINWLEGQLPGTVNGSARAMMKRVKELLNDLTYSGTVGGTADAITLTSAIGALADNKVVTFKASADNTGAATLAVNGLTAKAIRKISSGTDVALSAGDIEEAVRYVVVYDSAANSSAGAWIIVGSSASVAAATTSAAGIVELATLAETLAGTSTSLVPTVNNLYQSSGHISPDFRLSTNAGDATNDIDITAHVARDSTDSYNIVAAALTKQLDVAWAVGTNAGMLATGVAVTNTTYYLFDIKRNDTGVVDFAADTSSSGANIATNTNAAYTIKRAVGYVVRTGGVNAVPVMYAQPTIEMGGGAAPVGACRAWVSFNGTGTPAIRGSFNVSSITDNGAGDYTINYTTAMPDANYSVGGFCNFGDSTSAAGLLSAGNNYAPVAGSARLKTVNCTNGSAQDPQYCNVQIFR